MPQLYPIAVADSKLSVVSPPILQLARRIGVLFLGSNLRRCCETVQPMRPLAHRLSRRRDAPVSGISLETLAGTLSEFRRNDAGGLS